MPEFPVALSALVARIRRLLEDSPEVDVLNSSPTSSSTTITVTNTALYAEGAVIEIDDEVMMLTAALSGTTATVKRGYQGTTAAAHTTGAEIRIGPRFPVTNIKEAINTVLGNWISYYAPHLVWDSSTGGSFHATRDVYPVHADAIGVSRVCYKPSGRTTLIDVPHGPLETYPAAIASTGKGIEVYDQGPAGHPVYVLYEKPWAQLDSDAATVSSDFPVVMDSLIVEGAVLYLLGWRMVPKFKLDETVFAREQSESLPSNFNVQSLELMRRNWVAGMHRMTSMRAAPPAPKKVWRN